MGHETSKPSTKNKRRKPKSNSLTQETSPKTEGLSPAKKLPSPTRSLAANQPSRSLIPVSAVIVPLRRPAVVAEEQSSSGTSFGTGSDLTPQNVSRNIPVTVARQNAIFDNDDEGPRVRQYQSATIAQRLSSPPPEGNIDDGIVAIERRHRDEYDSLRGPKKDDAVEGRGQNLVPAKSLRREKQKTSRT